MILKVNDTPDFNLTLDLNVDYESESIEVEVGFWDKRAHSRTHYTYPAERFGAALDMYRSCETMIAEANR